MTWRAYVAGMLGGALDAAFWAVSYPNKDGDWDWATPVMRGLVGIPVAALLGLLAIWLVSRALGRLPARSPSPLPPRSEPPPSTSAEWTPALRLRHPRSWSVGLAAGAGTIVLFGPAGVLLLAALVGISGFPVPSAALIFAAVVAAPLGWRVGRAAARACDHRLDAERSGSD